MQLQRSATIDHSTFFLKLFLGCFDLSTIDGNLSEWLYQWGRDYEGLRSWLYYYYYVFYLIEGMGFSPAQPKLKKTHKRLCIERKRLSHRGHCSSDPKGLAIVTHRITPRGQ